MGSITTLLTTSGLVLVMIGLLLILFPFIMRVIPESVEKLHPFLVYVYRRGDFYFATSPILILLGIAYFLYLYLR